MMLSDVCLSVAYIGPKSRTERAAKKTKIGTEVAHVTRDSDTTFKVKRSKVTRSPGRFGWLSKSPLNLSLGQQFICHAQSEPLPVDLHKVNTCTGRGHCGHSVTGPLQATQIVEI